MLYINGSGDMFVRGGALRSLNSSVLHVVATAVDSGAPPRQVASPPNSTRALILLSLFLAICIDMSRTFDLFDHRKWTFGESTSEVLIKNGKKLFQQKIKSDTNIKLVSMFCRSMFNPFLEQNDFA